MLDDRYELLRRIGAGGTAVVWAALDHRTSGEVAVKLLHPELVMQKKNRMRFEREARVLEKLDHPNIAKLLDHRLDHGTPYFVLELLGGTRLADKIGAHATSDRPMQLELVLQIFGEICAGVSYAHDNGILHRDLKPGNVIVDPTKVLDFGLAKLSDAPRDQATTRGRQIGSYFYMAPEQTFGQEATVASDVFGLGCLLYEMLTLRRTWAKGSSGEPLIAFAGERATNSYNVPSEIMNRIRRDPRPKPSDIRPELEPFDDAIARALAVDRRERFHSAVELLDEVRACAGLDDVTVPLESMIEPTRVERQDSGASTLLEDTAEGGAATLLDGKPVGVPAWVWAAAALTLCLSALITLWIWPKSDPPPPTPIAIPSATPSVRSSTISR
jgi:eukaryotic-like serine/threonine-protein kinase